MTMAVHWKWQGQDEERVHVVAYTLFDNCSSLCLGVQVFVCDVGV